MKRIVSLIVICAMAFSAINVFAAETVPVYHSNIGDDLWETVVATPGAGWINYYDKQCVNTGTVAAFFDVTNPSEGNLTGDENDTYLKLTPKSTDSSSDSVNKSTFTIYSARTSPRGNASGHQYFSVNFKIDDLRTDQFTNYRLMVARLDFSPVWNLALKVGALSATQTIVYNGETVRAVNIGVGSADVDNMSCSSSNWAPLDTWYKYYIDVNYHTGKYTVGVLNLENDTNVFAPVIGDIDVGKYVSAANSATIWFDRDAATICIDDVVNWQEIFKVDEKANSITEDEKTVTATVRIGNDILPSAYNPAYSAKDPVMVVATYDENGTMLSAESKALSLPRDKAGAGAATMHDFSLTVEKPQKYSYANAYLWQLNGEINSLCEYWSNKE